MLRAIRSYFHPANINNSSEQLHSFISSLCTHFIDRLHLERYNKKWETKIPVELRLQENDITEFVSAVAPIAWLVLYNNYEEEARSVFSSLALIAPDTVIPRLLQQMSNSADVITEPHRLHVCIQAVSAVAASLVTNFPKRAFELLHSLVPAIDVNDIWRSTDICILRVYIAGRIVEPTVAGGILANMCRSAVQAAPVQGLQTFIPVLVTPILARLRHRHGDTDKQDEELQFNLQVGTISPLIWSEI